MSQKEYLSRENVETILELSLLQKDIFLKWETGVDKDSDILHMSFQIKGCMEPNLVREAWQETVRQTPSLRTIFRKARNRTVQVVLKQYPSLIEITNLNEPVHSLRDPSLRFNLMEEVAVNTRWIRKTDNSSLFILSCHRVILDKQALLHVFEDFMLIYDSLSTGKGIPAIHRPPFKEYLDWLAQQYWNPAFEQWKKELAHFSAPTTLTGYRWFDEKEGKPFSCQRLLLTEQQSDKLEIFSGTYHVPPEIIILAAWALLLNLYSRENHVVFGVELQGNPGNFKDTVGPFANLLPLNVTIDWKTHLPDFLKQIAAKKTFLLQYAYLTIEEIISNVGLPGETNIFESCIAVHSRQDQNLKKYENVQLEKVDSWQDQKHLFTLEVVTGKRWEFIFYCFEKGLPGPAALQVLHILETILIRMQETPGMKLSQLSFLSDDEAKRLEDFNHPEFSISPGLCECFMHRIFENIVEKSADHIALIGPSPSPGNLHEYSCQITYRELNKRANRLAHWLKKNEVSANDLVGIFCERSIEMLVAILAVFKSGGAYIPLDPANPDSRIKNIISNCRVKVIFTRQPEANRTIDLIKELSFSPIVFCLQPMDGDNAVPDFAALEGHSGENIPPVGNPRDTAYIIFTSGTTGVPNGAVVEYIGMQNHLQTKIRLLELTQSDKVIQNASHCFDISVWQFLSALMVGGQTIIYGNDIAMDPQLLLNSLVKDRATILECVPAVIEMILHEDNKKIAAAGLPLPDLRFLLSTGEALPTALCRKWMENYPHVPVVNAYGPTECSDDTQHRIISPDNSPEDYYINVALGKIIPNFKGYILDNNMRRLPTGCAGEICLTGIGVGKGYLNNQERTSQVFLKNPFLDGMGERLYRTGDLGFIDAKGQFVFLERIDFQVKIRGHRIELGEIETQLRNHPAVKQCVAVIRGESENQKRIIAYVVLKEPVTPVELLEYLQAILPHYMLPEHIMELEALPLNRSGKIDRKALPEPSVILESSQLIPPGTPMEENLAKIWEDVLEISPIGINYNFFQMGGHSLKIIQVRSRINKEFGIDIPVIELFKKPTILELAAFIEEYNEKNIPGKIQITRLPAAPYYPMSHAQQRFYFLHQLEPGNTVYNLPSALEFREALDIDSLKKAVKMVTDRQASLRTTFGLADNKPVQFVAAPYEAPFEFEDLSSIPSSQRRKIISERLEKEINFKFDFAEGPLFYSIIFKIEEQCYILFFNMHHIIGDLWSWGIFFKELFTFYKSLTEGSKADVYLPSLHIQYTDYAGWQNQVIEEGHFQVHEEFWHNQFSGEPPVLNLPSDFLRPDALTYQGGEVFKPTSKTCWKELNQLFQQQETTSFIGVLAAFSSFLSRLTGQEDIIIGTPDAGRTHVETENLIGFFVNTLPFRIDLRANPTFLEILNRVKNLSMDIFEHAEYPFDMIVSQLNLERDFNHHPLFSVMFQVIEDNQDENNTEFPLSQYPIPPGNIDFDLVGTFYETGEALMCSFSYSKDLFKEETIQCWLDQFIIFMEAAAASPGAHISDIPLLAPQQIKQLLQDFNNTRTEWPGNKTLHELFTEQAEQTPDHIAVFGHGGHRGTGTDNTDNNKPMAVTYRELSEQSDGLAYLLIQKGARGDSVIGIMMERCIEMPIGIMGILKAGCAYLPIDPDYPADRIQYMLKDSNAKILINKSESPRPGHPVENINDRDKNVGDLMVLDFEHLNFEFVSNFDIRASDLNSSNLAYVIYTSGSTGRPKGVLIEHRNAVNTITWRKHEYKLDANDKVLQLFSFAFDGFVTSFFTPIVSGSQVIFIPADDTGDPAAVKSAIISYHITHFICIPAFYSLLLDTFTPGESAPLKIVTLAGQELKAHVLKKNARFRVPPEIVNEYGATENSVATTCCRAVNKITDIHIGKPIANSKVYILDKYRNLLSKGAVGEIGVSGEGTGRGYLNQPLLTSEKFVPAAFEKGKRIYLTGDLARWKPGGNIEFSGRIDHQVKIRGFRIELGEIENCVLNYPDIKEAVVLAHEQDGGDKYLCAYIVSNREFEIPGLREFLAKTLPAYMIPTYFIPLSKMPLTANGKLDRKALPEPDLKTGEGYVAPRNEMEARLVGLWAEILGRDAVHASQLHSSIGIDDNFFHLGGHSLKATVLASRVHKELNVIVPLAEIFKTPTIRGLSEYIKRMEENIYESIMPVEEKEYDVLSFAHQRMYILQQIDLNSTAYNMPEIFSLPEEIDIDRLEEPFKKLIKRHESLRTSFHMIGDQPLQKIHREVDFKIERYDEFSIHQFVRAFDLSSAPLLRVGQLKTVGGSNYLLVDMHHIISDGISSQVLREDFMALYDGKELPPLRIQYKDFARWQTSPKQVERLHRQMLYWLKEFEGEIPVLEIPTDYPRPISQSFDGDSLNFEISTEETRDLNTLALQAGATPFMVLTAAVNILLSKLSSQEEIIIGTPIAGRRHPDLEKIIGMFVNTLSLRNYPTGEQTFKEFLGDIKERVLMAFENQEYPFEGLVDKLSLKRDMGRNPVFDVMLVLQNMNTVSAGLDDEPTFETDLSVQPDSPKEYENIAQTAKFDLTFTALEMERKIFFSIQYCTKLFKKETIERFITYFKKIVLSIVNEPGIKLQHIDIVSEKEKEQLLVDFNNTDAIFPKDKTIHGLFEEQVERIPDHIAVIGSTAVETLRAASLQITYRQLNEQSGRLAGLLMEKGVLADNIVAIMIERSVEMIIGIMGILKSGGAYLPIDPGYPRERIEYMLKKDSGAKLLVTTSNLAKEGEKVGRWEGEIYYIEALLRSSYPLTFLPSYLQNSSNLAYVIYTSGSTGRPKGVLVDHSPVINVLYALHNKYPLGPTDSYLLKTSYLFDVSVSELFGWFIGGGKLVILETGSEKDPCMILDSIERNHITHINFVPSMFNTFIEELSYKNSRKLSGLKYIFLAGEALLPEIVRRFRNTGSGVTGVTVENLYGPTEATVYTCGYSLQNWDGGENIPIGKPLWNVKICILNAYNQLQPVGIVGELCISGDGLARAYLNRPELTAEKFVISHQSLVNDNSTNDQCPMTFYRTGDLARWLSDGNIEFLGRIDSQLKIRGFRVELGEIENRLLNYPSIKETVVLASEDDSGDKSLCAYIVSEKEYEVNEVREFLLKGLPDYMIPSYFVRLEKIPLTPNGKVDRKALPKPELKAGEGYVPPRNEVEVKLVALWAELLNIQPGIIGIDRNFFELGGHSLKATILASRLHKELSIILPLAELFKAPTIRGLSEYIRGAMENIYKSIMPVEEKEYYVLSFAQQRMYILQQIDLNSTAYNMPQIIPLPEAINTDKLEESFKKLIKRHDSLRTSFHMIGDQPLQEIHREVDFKIEKYDEPGIHQFVRAFDLSCAPLLRVGRLKTAAGRNCLLADMHHIISDGISIQVLQEDFMAFHEGKELPPLRIQYKDFARWQDSPKEVERLHRQMLYWLQEFEGEIPVLEIPTDYPRPINQSFDGDSLNFEISTEQTRALNTVALQGEATLFMVLTAAVNILLSKLSSQEEIIIGTPIAGRRHPDLEKIIGMFVNTLSLRNYPTGEQTFKEFLGDIKERVLIAFENQEYPFEGLVDKLPLKRDMGRNPLFDVMLVLQNMNTASTDPGYGLPPGTEQSVRSDLPGEYENIARTAKFDLTFTAVELEREILFSIRYCTKLFKKETIQRFITYFKKIVLSITNDPGIKLQHIDVLSEKEKEQLLVDFNNTDEGYSIDKTIHQLFEEQVAQTPDHIALIAHETPEKHDRPVCLTYCELHKQSDGLARVLIEKGVLANNIVGIMAERSVEMIVGIMGILKSGGAYLPINPDYPQERVDYILKDSNAKVLVTNLSEGSFFDRLNCQLSVVNCQLLMSSPKATHHSSFINHHPDHLAYVIYTSGSTGNPKGVMVEHRSVINLVYGLKKKVYPYDNPVSIALISPIYFDASVKQIFPALTLGHRLVIVSEDDLTSGKQLLHLYTRYNITVSDGTPGHLVILLDTLSKLQLQCKIPVKRFVIGGDVLDPSLLRKLMQLIYNHDNINKLEIVNAYGPTECCDVTAIFTVTRDNINDYRRIPIGTPLGNVKVFIIGKEGNLQPRGVVGELCIAGAGLGRGYLNRPGLTAEKFDQDFQDLQDYQDEKGPAAREHYIEKGKGIDKNPLTSLPLYLSTPLYHTGDLARWLPDGNIEFLDRIDQQVKIRGFRVELGEIENHLVKHPGIKEAVLAARDEEAFAGKYLCAYVVSDREYQVFELREFLLKGLPDYMIPSYFVRLEKIPLTPNGKVDRRALPKPEIKTARDYAAPRNETETKLAGMWADVLNLQPDVISIDRSFFELGGHSLKATVLASRIHKELNVIVPLGEIFNAPTIRNLGEYIKNTRSNIQPDIGGNLVLIKEGLPGDNHLFFIHDGSGEVEGYVEFCKQLTNNFNCWGIRADRLENLAPRNVTIRELAETYIHSMKKIQPHGPYYIAGWSLGGTIAFEMTAQLEQTNEEITFLALIDSPAPHKRIWKDAVQFNLESEFNFVKSYGIGSEFDEKFKNPDGIVFDQFWSNVVDYLKINNFDVEMIKKSIGEFGMHVLPNYHQLSLEESVYYLNAGRTLSNARAHYTPGGKLNSQVHYFKASQSKMISHHQWKNYSQKSIKYNTIPGDHFSIFRMPDVVEFAKLFIEVLNAAKEKMSK